MTITVLRIVSLSIMLSFSLPIYALSYVCDYIDANGNSQKYISEFLPCDTTTTDIIVIVFGIVSSLAGIAIVGGIIYGAYMYMTAHGNTENTKKAMKIFTNVTIGIVLYAMAFFFLNWLVPGGLLK